MNGAVNEHTQALIDELMRSLKIQEELLLELSKMAVISAAGFSDGYAEQSYDRAVARQRRR